MLENRNGKPSIARLLTRENERESEGRERTALDCRVLVMFQAHGNLGLLYRYSQLVHIFAYVSS